MMRVSVIGTGNVGIATAADLSIKGHDVYLVKTSDTKSRGYDRLVANGGRVYLKENGNYTEAHIGHIGKDLSLAEKADVVIITIQSTYHERLYRELCQYLRCGQAVIVVCSYGSAFYLSRYCNSLPMIAETTGPYLEGRVELEDISNEVVFRVGCRLTTSPLSVFNETRHKECMSRIAPLFGGFKDVYSPIESCLLNPNMVLHTCGAVMSIPRIEYSNGIFCMYREAYSRKNKSTLNVMLRLDEEKRNVLQRLNSTPVNIFEAGGFLGNPVESFYAYTESQDRAVSPTSVRSRYITEDVSEGLVLLESIARHIGIRTPVATALIDISGAALGEDFRGSGRTMKRLGIERYIDYLRK